eukprot:m.293224 g.293224  ORF g.293224 m.293224 type:complete len:72 (-) comp19481_c0_seq1:355-570(-)
MFSALASGLKLVSGQGNAVDVVTVVKWMRRQSKFKGSKHKNETVFYEHDDGHIYYITYDKKGREIDSGLYE